MIFKRVKISMINQAFTITSLAKATTYTRGYVSNIINGHIESVRAKRMIALVLHEDYETLWSEGDASEL